MARTGARTAGRPVCTGSPGARPATHRAGSLLAAFTEGAPAGPGGRLPPSRSWVPGTRPWAWMVPGVGGGRGHRGPGHSRPQPWLLGLDPPGRLPCVASGRFQQPLENAITIIRSISQLWENLSPVSSPLTLSTRLLTVLVVGGGHFRVRPHTPSTADWRPVRPAPWPQGQPWGPEQSWACWRSPSPLQAATLPGSGAEGQFEPPETPGLRVASLRCRRTSLLVPVRSRQEAPWGSAVIKNRWCCCWCDGEETSLLSPDGPQACFQKRDWKVAVGTTIRRIECPELGASGSPGDRLARGECRTARREDGSSEHLTLQGCVSGVTWGQEVTSWGAQVVPDPTQGPRLPAFPQGAHHDLQPLWSALLTS